jgi:hypothetical protein
MGYIKGKVARGAVLLGMLVLLVPVASASAADTGTITGTVTDNHGERLTGIYVTASCCTGGALQTYEASTGTDDGHYTLQVPPGRYRVRFEDRFNHLYAARTWGVSNENSDQAYTTLTAGDTLVRDIALIRAGSIKGRVTDPAGQGIADVTVAWSVENGSANVPSPLTTKTRGDGRYLLQGLADCRTLRYDAPLDAGFQGALFGGPLGNSGGPAVCPGEWETLTKDITLYPKDGVIANTVVAQAAGAGGISGKVRGAHNKPLKGALAIIYNANGSKLKTVHTSKSGTFKFTGIRTGSYKLGFGAGGYKGTFYGSSNYASSKTVTVVNTKTAGGVNVKLKKNPR